MGRRRLAISLACALAVGLHANAATAFNHYLFAQVGQSTASISESVFDPEISTADASFQMGVPGTDPSARALFASVDSAAGLLDVSGITDANLNPNRSRAVARLEQRMSFPSSGDLPIVVDAQLLVSGSGSGGYISINAQLQVGDCIVGLSRNVGDDFASSEVGTSGCNDTGVVDWTATGGESALHITAVFAIKPAAFEVAAEVNGDFGGSVSDIPDGQFHNSGSLTIETQGRDAIYYSDSFLTLVPEPEHGLAAALGAIAWLARARARRVPRSEPTASGEVHQAG